MEREIMMSDKQDRAPSLQKDSTSAANLQQTLQAAFNTSAQVAQNANSQQGTKSTRK
jgi:hypothetical protein